MARGELITPAGNAGVNVEPELIDNIVSLTFRNNITSQWFRVEMTLEAWDEIGDIINPKSSPFIY